MKLIELDVLCRKIEDKEETDAVSQSYKNVLEELNLATESDDEPTTNWRPIFFNIQIMEQYLFTIEPRLDYEEDHCVVTYFDGKTIVIKKNVYEMVRILDYRHL